MKKKSTTLILLVTSLMLAINSTASNRPSGPLSITLPLGGNAWLSKNASARLRNDGISKWSAASDVISIYFRTEMPGQVELALKLNVPEGKSKITISSQGNTLSRELSQQGSGLVPMGSINIKKAGYIKLEIRGISRTGAVYADISDLIVSGPALEKGASYVKDNEGNFFYWGHRGPSVHLNYKIPAAAKTEWFYNEIMVPEGQDVLGTYYMANGFSGGYFGMQTNSPSERRVLFSIWSPFSTDNPKEIPDSMKVIMRKKGPNTRTGEFGNEGSGGQSYMIYPWKAGKSYAFLIRAQPDELKRSTTYTAYFKDLENGDWQLVASFERPQSANYLKGLHSFLECFSPQTGDQSRQALYQNQWAIDSEGQWQEVTAAGFSADNTARVNYRKDYAGGAEQRAFFLKNCGFFDDFTPIGSSFERKSSGRAHPLIDFSKLP